MDQSILKKIIEKGIRAPSGDNTQTWRFGLHDDHIDLFIESKHHKQFFEVGNRSLFLSAGAVIENMRVQSQTMGLTPEAQYFPETNNPNYVAKIFFKPGQTQAHPHAGALELRATNRKFYKPRMKIDDSVLAELAGVASGEAGLRLDWVKKGQAAYGKLSRLACQADQMRYQNQPIHEEFCKVLRLNAKNADTSRDGLDARTLEAGPMGRPLFWFISSWKRLRIANWFGMSGVFYFYDRLQFASSAAFGCLIVSDKSDRAYVRAGEIMERIWHQAEVRGLSMQPMMALPIFGLYLRIAKGEVLTPGQKEKMREIQDELAALLGITDQNELAFLFRAGYADRPSFKTLRRPVESFFQS